MVRRAMRANAGVRNEGGAGALDRSAYGLRHIERRVTGIVFTDDTPAVPGRHLLEVRSREAVSMGSNARP